jgi:hypothetical protein
MLGMPSRPISPPRSALATIAVLLLSAFGGHGLVQAQSLRSEASADAKSAAVSQVLRCDLPVALGTPGGRDLPTQSVPTHISVMPARYWDLVNTVAVYENTRVPLITVTNHIVGPAGGLDDIGSYYLIPELSIVTGWSAQGSIDFFYGICVGTGFIVGLCGLLSLFTTFRMRVIAALAILLLAAISFRVGDVYVFFFLTGAVGVPGILILVKRRTVDLRAASFLLTLGILIGTANAVRSHSGDAALIFAAALTLFALPARRMRRLLLFACVLVGILLPRVFFARMISCRDAFLAYRCPEYRNLTAQHPFWHSVYSGFGYLQNDFGIAWDDRKSFDKVQSIMPGTVYGSPQYEGILKHEVLTLLRRHPQFVFMTLASKFGVLLVVFLLFGNVGLLAAAFHPKPWLLDVAFWSAIMFNSLFGLLVYPLPQYMLGLASFATLYGVVSLSYALEPTKRDTRGIRFVRFPPKTRSQLSNESVHGSRETTFHVQNSFFDLLW